MFKVLFYDGNHASSLITGQNLRDCLLLQKQEKYKAFEPIAFRTQSGMLFYYDENIINTFISSEEMSLPELVENCSCKALYRNIEQVSAGEHLTIDKGSLWKQVNINLVIVSQEYYVESEIDQTVFEKLI